MPQLTEYAIHPAAELFPMMDAEAFEGLKRDIDENGVKECITLFQERIIDGRNRYKAMRELGIDPACHAAELEECDDPVAYVLSLNLHRRHLNETQRATVAAKIANMKEGRPSKDTASIDAVSESTAAEMLSVGRASVQRAKHAIDKGAPSVVSAMETGELPASVAAKFVDVVPDKKAQEKIAKQGPQAIKDEVKKAAAKPEKNLLDSRGSTEPVKTTFTVPEPDRDVLNEFIPFWNGLTAKQRRTIKIWIHDQEDD